MATTFKWQAPETFTNLLTTGLNSLATSTSIITGKVLSTLIANSTGLYEFINFQMDVTFGTAPTAGAYIGLWILTALDGTNFEDGSTTIDPARSEDVYIPLLLSTSAQKIAVKNIVIPPYDFKILLRNKSVQAMAASGNILSYTRAYEQGV